MLSRFFIDRPVFASVISLLIIITGLVSMFRLPVARYPQIVPPTVQIKANYPGADAETVSQAVAGPIEQQLSGAQNMIYFDSVSANDGSLTVTATFEIGTNQDLAAVDIQNRLSAVTQRLPQDVVRQGIQVIKTSNDLICVVALRSETGEYTDVELSNYATINVLDQLKRVPGAGDVQVFGAKDYSMRIWVNPERLSERGLTVTDVSNAIREQNAVFAAGRIGQRPSGSEVELTVPVLTRGRLSNVSDYENIIVRAEPDGSTVRIKDVARVELGAQSYDLFGRMDARPTTLVLVFLRNNANAIETYRDVLATMDRLSPGFPHGVKYEIPYETVSFIQVSIEEVVTTLLEAVALVLVVVFFFLQSWRATLIPLLAVPVSIIGTFAGMLAMGFSINTLTLFGLVLAIGIVVDDAIVVVENVERIMEEQHLPVREATIKAMHEVTGPVVAIVLVLSAVFLPVAFLGGLTGELYRQFAVTIAISVIISGFVALTLSPALCRVLLRPKDRRPSGLSRVVRLVMFGWFNWIFSRMTRAYTGTVRLSIRLGVVTILIFGGLCFVAYRLFERVPGGFIPEEDQGYVISVQVLPDGASLDRTDKVASQVEQFYLSQKDTVLHTVTLGGLDLFAGRVSATNAAVTFARLKPWDERQAPGHGAKDLVGMAWGRFGQQKEGYVITVNPPPIQGLGFRAGFELQLQARAGQDVRELSATTEKLLGAARQRPELSGLNGTLRVIQPQLYVDLDRDRAKTLGVPINSVFEALQAYLGQLYVNDFDKFGRVWRVQVQAEPEFRRNPEDIGKIFVRSQTGQMVPLSALVTTSFRTGPNIVPHFNGYPSVQITGAPNAGYSTGQAMQAMREVAASVLPVGYGYEWSGSSYQEIKAGSQAPAVIGFGLIVVFLVLAAQYENWTLPIAVLAIVPLGALGALAAVYLRGLERDIYFQIGLLTLVGLSAKNAILIVEFASHLRREGRSIREAAIEASRLRLRPIIMTSLAFILGVLPLVVARGAGASGRHSIGTGIMGGMIAATALAIVFVPLFFVIIQWFSERFDRQPQSPAPQDSPAHETVE